MVKPVDHKQLNFRLDVRHIFFFFFTSIFVLMFKLCFTMAVYDGFELKTCDLGSSNRKCNKCTLDLDELGTALKRKTSKWRQNAHL